MNDLIFLKDIHRKFGKVKLKTFPLCGIFKYRIYYAYIKGMKRVAPLNMIPYDKKKAEAELREKFGWVKYENKHYENVFTRFYECYFSNMILTGEMTREEALKKLAKPPYDEELMKEDIEYVAKKLGITVEELNAIIEGENKTYKDYKNIYPLIRMATKFARLVGVEKRNFR
jgi:hypothetical protein